VKKSLDSGATDYVTKPVDAERVAVLACCGGLTDGPSSCARFAVANRSRRAIVTFEMFNSQPLRSGFGVLVAK